MADAGHLGDAMGELGLLAGIFVIWCIALGHRSIERAGLHPVLMYAVAVMLTVLGVAIG